MRVRRVGGSALLIECADAPRVEAWRAELWRRRDELACTDIIPGARTVLLDGVDQVAAERILATLSPEDLPPRAEERIVVIRTTFDGVDLSDVAERWGVPVHTAVARLTETPLVVAFCGFAPGFAYLRGLPDDWAVPRLPAPRPRVPAGSVALAGPYAGIYPTASPGGWRLVGHTEQTLFDVRAQPPALLTPGTRVQLEPAR